MAGLTGNTPAPELRLPDVNGILVSLADFHGQRHVLLVFSRGFF